MDAHRGRCRRRRAGRCRAMWGVSRVEGRHFVAEHRGINVYSRLSSLSRRQYLKIIGGLSNKCDGLEVVLRQHGRTYDKNVDLPTSASPSKSTLTSGVIE